MFRTAWALFRKDALAEQRSRTALNASLLFSVTTLVAMASSLGANPVAPRVQSALLWVILFFAATAGLGRSFVAEEESGTALALRLSGSANAVLLGKLMANLALMILLEVIVLPLFITLLHLPVRNWGGFASVVALGTVGLSATATMAAAVVAKARGRGELLAPLAFPLLIAVLFGAISGTNACLTGARESVVDPLRLLVSYDGVFLTVAFMVFEVLWEE